VLLFQVKANKLEPFRSSLPSAKSGYFYQKVRATTIELSLHLVELHGNNGFVTATKLGRTNKFLLLQPKILPQQPNVLLIELNFLLF